MISLNRRQLQDCRPLRVKPRYHGKLARALSSLNRVLAGNIRYSANGKKVVSHATVDDRNKCFAKMIRDLHALGFTLREVKNLKPRHVQALASHWESQGLSASSLQKRFSYLRLLCQWIGKSGMVGDAGEYLHDPGCYRREYATRRDKSWRGQDIDHAEVIARIDANDPHVAMVLRLIFAFGLRLQEASLFRPALDDQGDHIQVIAGTKGGRPRTVPIETDEQRSVLMMAHEFAVQTGRSMIPKSYTLKQWLRHVYHVLEANGVSRKNGIVAHGGRHEYANDLFEALTGEPTGVRGGSGENLSREDERVTRLEVSARLGHSRIGIVSAYCGKVMTGRRLNTLSNWQPKHKPQQDNRA